MPVPDVNPPDSTSETQRKIALLQNSSGPSPWFSKSFPTIHSASRQKFTWKDHGPDGDLAFLTALELVQEPGRPRLVLNTFCVPFVIAPDRLGIWCPEPGEIRVLCFDPDQLAAFKYEEVVGWFKQSNDRVYSAVPPLDEFSISTKLAAGTHALEVPECFRNLDELLVTGARSAPTSEPNRDSAACSIFALYLQAGLVESLPQNWFTANQYDVGRQWITRLARDPITHHILGEGARMGSFELTTEGTKLLNWLAKE